MYFNSKSVGTFPLAVSKLSTWSETIELNAKTPKELFRLAAGLGWRMSVPSLIDLMPQNLLQCSEIQNNMTYVTGNTFSLSTEGNKDNLFVQHTTVHVLGNNMIEKPCERKGSWDRRVTINFTICAYCGIRFYSLEGEGVEWDDSWSHNVLCWLIYTTYSLCCTTGVYQLTLVP